MRSLGPQIIVALLCVLIVCCKRETSLEGLFPPDTVDTSGTDTTDVPDTLNLDTTATFTMATSPNGSCKDALIQGSYVSGELLTESHTVTLEVEVTYPGQWDISTPTVNGIFFANAGIFTKKGLQTITLLGNGAPGETGYTIVPITAGNSTCGFAVNITDP